MSFSTDRWLIALAVIVPCVSAEAKTATKKAHVDPARAEAEASANKATVAFNLGRFEEALDGYAHAYELVQISGLLFNIGQCHRRLGHHDKAIFFFGGYLRENPKAKNADAVLAMIEEEKKNADAEKPVVVAATLPASTPFAEPPLALAAPANTPLYEKWWFWTAIVGGAAIVATAIAVPLAIAGSGPAKGTLGLLDRSQ